MDPGSAPRYLPLTAFSTLSVGAVMPVDLEGGSAIPTFFYEDFVVGEEVF